MTKKLKIMVVDDDFGSIEYIKGVIKQIPDLRLKKTFTNPIAALSYLLKKRVDILLLDVDMPLLDGFQLMKQIQHLINPCDPSTPPLFVVLCSGYVNNPEDCFENRAIYYLQKPLILDGLIKAKIAIQERLTCLSTKKSHVKERELKKDEVLGRSGNGLSEEDLISIKDAESILGVKRGKIKKMRDKGELTNFGKDGRVRLSRKEVEEAKIWYSIPKGKV